MSTSASQPVAPSTAKAADPRRAKPVAKRTAPQIAPTAENTKPQILEAAAMEFAAKGLAGARVDSIAEASGCNKAMIYYFFKSKEALYLAVLEQAYAEMREHERGLDLGHLPPLQALRRLVEFKFDYVGAHPMLIGLLNGENVNDARYLRRSTRVRDMHSPLVATISGLLAKGVAEGTIRPEIDPVQLYISVASLSYFYFSNGATLGFAFGRKLMAPKARALRREHAVEVILRYVQP
jgi:AcrR family transcriptional regulator